MLLTTLANSNIHIPLSVPFLVGIFLVLLVIWIIHMIVMRYHWNNYGNSNVTLLKANILYFLGSFLLFAVLGISLLTYAATSSL
jgi:uncharacterized protein YqgC (DUF456 family)